jgi:nitroreductase
MKTQFQNQPVSWPTSTVSGQPLKPLPQVMIDRRATAHFKPDPVPPEYLEAILRFGAQAPSGYNLQPWRFLVLQKKENRERLQRVAFGQPKIAEAPVVIVAFATQNEWQNTFDAVFEEGVRRGCGQRETLPKVKQQAAEFLKQVPQPVWLNRHTMIAVASMMLLAETFGLDTAPMEGFDAAALGKEFGLPENAEIVALLAVGFGQQPDKPYGGRLDLSEIVHDEAFGQHWPNNESDAEHSSRRIFEEIQRKANEPFASEK